MCWIGNKWASALFLALPLSLVLVCNVVLYVRTVSSIRHVSKLVRKESSPRGGEGANSGNLQNRGKRDLVLYVRIIAILGKDENAKHCDSVARAFFLDVGFTWFFGLLTIFVPPDAEDDWADVTETILVFLYVIFNGLQVIQ